MSSIEELTPTQRVAHLAFWYMSEVYNGGHDQYFGNQSHLDHREVIQALQSAGASEHAEILAAALDEEAKREGDQCCPNNNHCIPPDEDYPLAEFDREFGECRTTIEEHLENYLDRHEDEFVEWVP